MSHGDKDEELILSLLDRDPELQRYYDEHVDLERQLASFKHKGFLTPEKKSRRSGSRS